MRRFVLATLIWLGLSHISVAQDASNAAVLVADSVFVSADRQLVAEGNVEVYQACLLYTSPSPRDS